MSRNLGATPLHKTCPRPEGSSATFSSEDLSPSGSACAYISFLVFARPSRSGTVRAPCPPSFSMCVLSGSSAPHTPLSPPSPAVSSFQSSVEAFVSSSHLHPQPSGSGGSPFLSWCPVNHSFSSGTITLHNTFLSYQIMHPREWNGGSFL